MLPCLIFSRPDALFLLIVLRVHVIIRCSSYGRHAHAMICQAVTKGHKPARFVECGTLKGVRLDLSPFLIVLFVQYLPMNKE